VIHFVPIKNEPSSAYRFQPFCSLSFRCGWDYHDLTGLLIDNALLPNEISHETLIEHAHTMQDIFRTAAELTVTSDTHLHAPITAPPAAMRSYAGGPLTNKRETTLAALSFLYLRPRWSDIDLEDLT